MSPRDTRYRLEDMAVSARDAIDLAKGRSPQDLNTDRVLRAAIERFIEIIGEAAKHVDEETKAELHEINWSGATGMRDIITHAYHRVEAEVLWATVQDSLPQVLSALEKYLDKTGAD